MTTQRSYDALGRITSATSLHTATSTPPGEDDGRDGEDPPPPPSSVKPETVTWTYDGSGENFTGRLSSMTDPAGTTVYRYDRRGLLTEEQRIFSGCFVTRESRTDCEGFFASRTFTTGYRYDKNGNRSTIRYPSEKVSVNYTFDHAGRPLSASGAVTSAEYLPFGPLRQIVFANGTKQTLAYDARYRMTQNIDRGHDDARALRLSA